MANLEQLMKHRTSVVGVVEEYWDQSSQKAAGRFGRRLIAV